MALAARNEFPKSAADFLETILRSTRRSTDASFLPVLSFLSLVGEQWRRKEQWWQLRRQFKAALVASRLVYEL